MENSNAANFAEITLTKIKEMVDANSVVGTPITTADGVTLIPVSRVSLGFGSGGSDYKMKDSANVGFGGGGGAGVKLEPIGFVVINGGSVRMLNIGAPANTTIDRAIELIPELVEKADTLIDKYKKDKK